MGADGEHANLHKRTHRGTETLRFTQGDRQARRLPLTLVSAWAGEKVKVAAISGFVGARLAVDYMNEPTEPSRPKVIAEDMLRRRLHERSHRMLDFQGFFFLRNGNEPIVEAGRPR
jgi:hypothetical protein